MAAIAPSDVRIVCAVARIGLIGSNTCSSAVRRSGPIQPKIADLKLGFWSRLVTCATPALKLSQPHGPDWPRSTYRPYGSSREWSCLSTGGLSPDRMTLPGSMRPILQHAMKGCSGGFRLHRCQGKQSFMDGGYKHRANGFSGRGVLGSQAASVTAELKDPPLDERGGGGRQRVGRTR